jgi:hypothetical protein
VFELSTDVNGLTLGEIEKVEDLIDASIDSVAEKGARKGRFLRAVAFVVMLRDNPDATWEDAGNVRLSPGKPDAEGNAEAVTPNRAARRAQSRKPA